MKMNIQLFAKYLDDTGAGRLVQNIKTNFQPKLVSGTNIKTINNTSILGSGNITISGGGSYTATAPIDITNSVISGTFDNTPTANSTNFISSGAVKSYVDTTVGNIDTLLTNLNSGGGV